MLRIISFWRLFRFEKHLPVGALAKPEDQSWKMKFVGLTGPLDQNMAKSQPVELHCLFVLGCMNWSRGPETQDAIVEKNEGLA